MAKTSVYFYVPNIIGYMRIVLAIIAFYVITENYTLFFFLYGLSAALDMADGYAARYFDQCSEFGAVLDQITDRATTASLIVILSHFYPAYTLGFVALNAIDLVSHFARLTSTYMAKNKSHKDVSPNHPWILRVYYTSRPFLAIMCGGNELFYCLLYYLYFTPGPEVGGIEIAKMGLLISTPIWALKQVINVIQLCCAMMDIAEFDTRERRN
mmetsp:Transcript_29781/g.41135  ORF Transcript_29781/g.41135 Transcript_29781/m.41135 type:complete len:212 (+) Transcript_29781:121-756(+)|eukprot:CAMPEP_0201490510 /NCGR_PEP_ID=MMETSP0151_2-20130828/26601_1 /ASSEMBLY_ACC=CAM_ASM_000257 /TAXON_ID=200890 /ORGANISM="Paramoeba atlantica, Strain 621/1 / CCAP 1560/9" /LENGTH=211 /DNA_ID=CAMNT_0047876497 /DNA_START=117 /DNA_END=752 /DNA_ORIENTATION=+